MVRLSAWVGVLLAPHAPALAQRPDSTPPPVAPVISAIRFERHDIYTAREARSFLPRLVNRLHIQTRRGVIEREVLFAVGEPYDSARVTETARNLRSLGVFRRVRVDTARSDSGFVVLVATQDAWSTQPDLTISTAGGQAAWRVSLVEENLFGTASNLTLSYAKDPDRTATLFGFSQPRLVAGRIGLSVLYDDRSDGHFAGALVSRPYLTLEARHAWSVGADTRDERILRFFEGQARAADTMRRRLDGASVSYGRALRADSRGYLRLAVGGRIWRDDFAPGDGGGPVSGSRPVAGLLSGTLEWRRARYAVVPRFRASREEDVDLSTTIRFGLALSPEAFGFAENGVVPRIVLRQGAAIRRSGFGYLDLAAHGRFTGSGLDSGSVQAAATVAYLPATRHVAILHAWGGWLENPRPGGEFDLGLGVGPRAYRLHAFTGDRGVFGTAEYRVMFAEDFLTVADVGIAGFADWGGAWYSGERRRTAWDFGIGLRIGPSRSTDIFLHRIDLTYRAGNEREASGWVLVIGKGFVFSTTGSLSR